jgi:hypothetical protein
MAKSHAPQFSYLDFFLAERVVDAPLLDFVDLLVDFLLIPSARLMGSSALPVFSTKSPVVFATDLAASFIVLPTLPIVVLLREDEDEDLLELFLVAAIGLPFVRNRPDTVESEFPRTSQDSQTL